MECIDRVTLPAKEEPMSCGPRPVPVVRHHTETIGRCSGHRSVCPILPQDAARAAHVGKTQALCGGQLQYLGRLTAK